MAGSNERGGFGVVVSDGGSGGDGQERAEAPPMTDAEALLEARQRWGERAEIAHELTCVELFMVGEQVPGAEMPEWHGIGRSWELAFREADARAARQD